MAAAPDHHHDPLPLPSDPLGWAIQECRARGLRRTHALKKVLEELIRRSAPTSLVELAASEALEDACDRATLYRLLIRLEEKGMVRRIGVHERSAHFVMQFPGQHGDYLVCKSCGDISKLDIECPVEALEKSISKESGYADLFHELEFYGTCPSCQGKAA